MNILKIASKLGLPLVLVVFLFGCDFLKIDKKVPAKEKDISVSAGSGVTLLNINGKPVLKESDYVGFLNQMMQANPYFRGAGPEMLPAAVKRKFFDELIKQELIVSWAEKNNVENSSEFKKSYDEIMRLAKRSLLIQQFEKQILDNIKITDKDINNEFSMNKDKFIKIAGGSLVSGIEFNNPEKATEFYDKVQNVKTVEAFEKAAKKENEDSFKDFGRVGSKPAGGQQMPMDDVPSMIRNKVSLLVKLPVVEKVKVGRVTWVFYVSDKKDDVFFELGEIKPQIEMMLKNAKFRDEVESKVEGLKKDFTISVNEDYFKKMEQKESATKEAEKEEPAILKKEKVKGKSIKTAV